MSKHFVSGALLAVLFGCSGSSSPPRTTANDPSVAETCADGVRGKRYTVCGKIAALGTDLNTVHGKKLTGQLRRSSGASGRRYTLQGGFDAQR